MDDKVSVRKALVAGLVLTLAVLNIYQAFSNARRERWLGDRLDAMSRAWPLPPDDQWVIGRFHQIYYYRLIWANNRFLGIQTEQNPDDVWIHQEIIADVKPDYIVEAGTLKGGSAALWATILQQVNPVGRVITIDIQDATQEARKLPIFRDKVDFLLGSSTAPEIVAEVKKRVAGKKVLVILDSDHHKEHVLNELKAYSPMVSVGSYLIVQDTNINGHPVLPGYGPGPLEAVWEFLASNKEFVRDEGRERMLFTMHPGGYLKRLR